MKILWGSDWHFGIQWFTDEYWTRFIDQLSRQDVDAILVSGDTADGLAALDFLSVITDHVNCPVYFVLGNHDYYGHSIGLVRHMAKNMTTGRTDLVWLHNSLPVIITPATAIVGVDGWGDGGYGVIGGGATLNNFNAIEDMQGDEGKRAKVMRGMGVESAFMLKIQLDALPESVKRVIVVTHVPPFVEACYYENEIQSKYFQPYFACKATGDVIREFAAAHPDINVDVLCGHTHYAADLVDGNVHTRVMGVEYGDPKFEILDI